jgi:hypothetical protein
MINGLVTLGGAGFKPARRALTLSTLIVIFEYGLGKDRSFFVWFFFINLK